MRLVTVLLVLAPAACGDDSDADAARVTPPAPASTAPPTPTASPGSRIHVAGLTANYHGFAEVGPSGEVTIDLAADHFAPTVLRGAPGQRVTITLRNTGETPHHFVTADQQLIVEVQPGLTAEGRITLPRSGNLSFFCLTHKADGMAGGFNVSGPIGAPDPKASPTPTRPADDAAEPHDTHRPGAGAPSAGTPTPGTPSPGLPSPR